MHKRNLNKSNTKLVERAIKAAVNSVTIADFEKLIDKMQKEDIEILVDKLTEDRVLNPKKFFAVIKQLSKCNRV